MSIRETRRKGAEDAQDVIETIQFQIENLTKELNLLKLAQQVLSETPKVETKTGMTVHYAQSSAWIDRCECSECGETLQGYQKMWKFCPSCGSTIVTAEKEDTPGDRLARNAVREAVASVIAK
jgi:hypothetical protein